LNERVVVLHPEDGISFVADACAAVADAVNGVRPARSGEVELTNVYAEMVRAYARLVRPRLIDRREDVRVAVIDHLLGRLDEAEAGARAIQVVDIVDRLHGELVRDDVLV
jgi:hypothetical protein